MTVPAWSPSPGDVAAHIPQRFGGAAPSASTVPTEAQVERLIEFRLAEVVSRCGDPPEANITLAQETVVLGVCAYLESSFFPEQQLGGQDDVAMFFRLRYEEHLRLLLLENLAAEEDDGEGD